MQDQHLPEPMVPSEVDLGDYEFIPLKIARLRRSKQWLIAKRRPEIGFYSINLWTAAWHEHPAGSIDPDDDWAADAAMCAPDRWDAVKADALRGWILCRDGRLYHPVVAEIALEGWARKLETRYEKECERLRKAWKRAGHSGKAKLPSLGDYLQAKFPQTFAIASRLFPADRLVLSGGHDDPSGGQTDVRPTRPGNGSSSDTCPVDTPVCPPDNRESPADFVLKGQGQGQGQRESSEVEKKQQQQQQEAARVAELEAMLPPLLAISRISRGSLDSHLAVLRTWIGFGIDIEQDALPVIRAKAADELYRPPHSLRWFTQAILEAKVARGSAKPASAPADPVTPDEIRLTRGEGVTQAQAAPVRAALAELAAFSPALFRRMLRDVTLRRVHPWVTLVLPGPFERDFARRHLTEKFAPFCGPVEFEAAHERRRVG